jgi:isocitrate dehydrogenase
MRKRVTIDFYNLMHDATLLKTSEFAQEIIKHIDTEPPIEKGE